MSTHEMRNLNRCIEIEGNNQVLKSMDYVISSNHRGNLFGISLRTTITASGTVSFGMTTPSNAELHIIPVVFGSDKLCFIDFYKGGTYSGGTSLVDNIWSNNHLLLPTSHVTEFKAGVTIDTYGDNYYLDVIPAGKFSSGEALAGRVGWLLEKGEVYTAEINNQESQAGYLSFKMFWIEIDDKSE